VILLHAFPLDGEMWGDLAGERVDYPGDGSLAGWADMVAARMAEPAAVCGLSMGGYAAFELVRRHPDKVARLVLADTRAAADTPDQRAARDAHIEAVREAGAEALWERVGGALFAPGADPSVVARGREIAHRQPPARLIGMLQALRDRADSTDLLGAIRVPVTVVCGALDAITPASEARALAAAIPGAGYVEIAGAGHLSAMEQPRAFTWAVYGSG
jgi:3-oxoadipate enol-lactonase